MVTITRNVFDYLAYILLRGINLFVNIESEKEIPMGEKREAPPRGAGFWGQLIGQFRLSWALFLDNRVPWVLKMIPLGAAVYVISPLDLIPDVIPILGQLDDIGILMTALRLFNTLAPADIVAEHSNRLGIGNQAQISHDNNETVIDVEANRD